MPDFQNKIIQAIQLIANNTVQNAQYDKTIQARIINQVSGTSNEYRVRYQDSTFSAFTRQGDQTVYASNNMVNITVPRGDMSAQKKITGLATSIPNSTDPVVLNSLHYDVAGVNCIGSNETYNFSIRPNQRYYLYTAEDFVMPSNARVVDTQLTVFDDSFYQVKDEADNICIAAEFQSHINRRNWGGNYGLTIGIKFRSPAYGIPTIRYYTIDITDMIGTPYNFYSFKKQQKYFSISNLENFDEIYCVQFFVKDIGNYTEREDFIAIKNISFVGAKERTQQQINVYNVNLISTNGNSFSANASDTERKTLRASLYYRNTNLNVDNQRIFYWFRQNMSIDTGHEKYCAYAGRGWQCLNTKTNGDWVPTQSSFAVTLSMAVARNTKFRCVIRYNDNNYYRDITIQNLKNGATLQLNANPDHDIYVSSSRPTLTCIIKRNGAVQTASNFTYKWGIQTSNNNSIFIDSNNVNTFAHSVNANILSQVKVDVVDNYAIFKCSAYQNGAYIGTAQKRIVNSSTQSNYRIVLEHGNQVFQYNQDGLSPTHQSNETPQTIDPITFKIYDRQNNQVAIEQQAATITWHIPTSSTLLQVANVNDGIVTGATSLNFTIADSYSISTNNQITLNVTIGNDTASATTNLVFLKQGELGTNGTGFVCRLELNGNGTGSAAALISTTNNSSTLLSLNYNNNIPYTVKLWNNGSLVSNNQLTIRYSMLQGNNGYSTYVINGSNGTLSLNSSNTSLLGNVINIIKCEVTYNHAVYYAFAPIITVVGDRTKFTDSIKNFNFSILYNSSGRAPVYNNRTNTLSVPGATIQIKGDNASYTVNNNVYRFTPAQTFSGNLYNSILLSYNNNETLINIPFLVSMNRFEMMNINGWDGQTIQISQEQGYILSPLVGAGEKDQSNGFTGVLMGKVGRNSQSQTGLFAYNSGTRSISIDASNGKATFGTANGGQIVIDPSSATGAAYLQSGNYVSGTNGRGMRINLTQPSINFGSGNFSVNAEGVMTCKGANIQGYFTTSAASDLALNELPGSQFNDLSNMWGTDIFPQSQATQLKPQDTIIKYTGPDVYNDQAEGEPTPILPTTDERKYIDAGANTLTIKAKYADNVTQAPSTIPYLVVNSGRTAQLQPGKYTFSAYVNGRNLSDFDIYFKQYSSATDNPSSPPSINIYSHSQTPLTSVSAPEHITYTDYTKITKTFEVSSSLRYLQLFIRLYPCANIQSNSSAFLFITKPQLEKGQIATAYKPYVYSPTRIRNNVLTVDNNGILMRGGAIKIEAGSSLQITSHGEFSIDSSNFKVDKNTGMVTMTGADINGNLKNNGAIVLTQNNIRVSVTQPTDPKPHMVWIKPIIETGGSTQIPQTNYQFKSSGTNRTPACIQISTFRLAGGPATIAQGNTRFNVTIYCRPINRTAGARDINAELTLHLYAKYKQGSRILIGSQTKSFTFANDKVQIDFTFDKNFTSSDSSKQIEYFELVNDSVINSVTTNTQGNRINILCFDDNGANQQFKVAFSMGSSSRDDSVSRWKTLEAKVYQ